MRNTRLRHNSGRPAEAGSGPCSRHTPVSFPHLGRKNRLTSGKGSEIARTLRYQNDLSIYTRATEDMQHPATAALVQTFLDPAVDTPLTMGSGSAAKALYFLAICRTFRSGGTRIRTGDTMIFSHMQKPLGMGQTRIGKRICVQGVPMDTTWFCPYCCVTVDTAFATVRDTGSRTRTSAGLTRLFDTLALRRPSET
jgi:hypothetical protein